MSDRDDPSTDRHRKPSRQVDLTTAAALALATLAGGGGLGSAVTASNVSAELRETRATIVGRLDRIDQHMGEQDKDAEDVQRRLREIELWRASTAPR